MIDKVLQCLGVQNPVHINGIEWQYWSITPSTETIDSVAENQLTMIILYATITTVHLHSNIH